MTSEEELARGLARFRVSKEKLEKIKTAATEFMGTPDVSVESLAEKHGFPRRSLYYYFKKLGLLEAKEKVSVAEKKIRETEIGALTDEAEKIATIAIGIGGVIARRYLPLISHLLSENRTLEMVAQDVMEWYEMKMPTQKKIEELETKIESLKGQLSEAYIIAMPNYKYTLRAHLVLNYAKHILVARMNGIRIPVRSTLHALHNDLITLEKDIEAIVK